jgi:hypothetical protein
MIAPRHRRTAEEKEPIIQAMQKPLERLKADLLEICQIDEEIGAAAIVSALRTNVPVILEYVGIK